jgi:lipopolysaccharide/colanic/teichoic acid biosynthesis glycosyltransferase
MRLLPTSRVSFSVSVSPWDLSWAAASPFLALLLRESYILGPEGLSQAILYCALAFVSSLVALVLFRVNNSISRFFSVQDALRIVQAVVLAELGTGAALFFLTRLEGIPRSTPLIHILLLAVGLIGGRVVVRIFHASRENRQFVEPVEHLVLLGATPLASVYIKLVQTCFAGRRDIIAVLDNRRNMIGRVISGVPIAGGFEALPALIEEYEVHGVPVTRVAVADFQSNIPGETVHFLKNVCSQHNLKLEYLPQSLGLDDQQRPEPALIAADESRTQLVAVKRYFRLKQAMDFITAGVLFILLFPLFGLAAGLVLIDVGLPVYFWQQRKGLRGRNFLLYKFRTLRSPFDRAGRPVPPAERLSAIGHLLRRTRLDELPQLWNVLVGDMALIGPRPLLPKDQPSDPTGRLAVRPGLTGWAQVNGGTQLTPDEKHTLDEWYIKHASISLDLKILLLTVATVFMGERAWKATAGKHDVWDAGSTEALPRST